MVVFVLPNTINFRERNAFSDSKRIEWAMEHYPISSISDSVVIEAGPWYDRGSTHYIFFGEKYRDLWQTPVQVAVLKWDSTKGGLEPVSIGGSQQTIGLDVEDKEGREWALRGVNKDQSKALPGVLRPTIMRFMFRDQGAALNPYGALVVPVLAEAINILHTNPEIVFVPYDERKGEYNERMAGRLALLEEDADGSWEGAEIFGKPDEIEDTEDMLEAVAEKGYAVDTLLYARSRLFDILISDWDRHEGQWNWALVEEEDQKIFKPLPRDRDMAFYHFDEGLFSHITLLFNNKFQSFHPDYENVKGLTKQSIKLDRSILKSVDLPEMLNIATEIQEQLTDAVIQRAFKQYPPEIYQKVGKEHEQILKSRLEKLPEAAKKFWEIVH
ncbi:hypothetical protein D770_03110 [Flammeovirgaceae bacterium 311]|nr:hypothetical protein D770_03110 [Flammeovirgaceae bacterium 311]